MSFLNLIQLTKTFPDGTEAVKDIDLSIAEGEFMVLLGPSGCGKTTTLRMVAGLETPSGGRVVMNDQDIGSLRPSQRDVGFVFQFYSLYPHLSVRENIAFPLICGGMKKAEISDRVEMSAQSLHLESMLGFYPRQLSGGDQQRVALARAMIRRPRIYLMDEPLGTLDADRRLEMREVIRSQQQETGVTTIYVTHDQEEAMSLADRIVVMNKGKILQIGRPSHVYDDPADLFVADFVGSPSMNFFDGQVIRDANSSRFTIDGSDVIISLRRDAKPGPVRLGIRSEYVRVRPEGPIEGQVVVDEYLGSHRNVYVETNAGRLVMRDRPQNQHPPGQALRLNFDGDHLRLFDSRTGARI